MRGAVMLAALVLTACADEPTFDERFDKASKQVRTKAADIDRELARPPASTPAPDSPPPS